MNTKKCTSLILSVFYAVQQSYDFLLLTALQPTATHLPGPPGPPGPPGRR
jgi:hypothetical protein